MPPEKSDLKYVWDMLDAARTIVEITAGRTLHDYERAKIMRLAVERAVEIIGEAARCVSTEFRDRHPGIPWSPIIATRHIIAHEYGEIQHDKIWRIAVEHVPALIAQIEPLVGQNPPASAPTDSGPSA